jgi:hypothetical protein
MPELRRRVIIDATPPALRAVLPAADAAGKMDESARLQPAVMIKRNRTRSFFFNTTFL